MPSSYVNNLRLTEMATGEETNNWGNVTNTNLELVGEALGYGTENLASDADATITIADGAADAARSLYLRITSTTLTATRTVTLAPNTVSKVWIIENATTGGQSIIIKQGTGATVTIANGKTVVVYTDGAGAGAKVVDGLTNLEISGTGTLGKLGIGISNPLFLSTLAGSDGATNMMIQSTAGLYRLGFYNDSSQQRISTYNSTALTFAVTESEKMRLDTGGRFLINKSSTQTANATLQVASSLGTGQIFVGNSSGTGWMLGRDNVTTGNFLLGEVSNDADSSVTNFLNIVTGTGNVGIGVVPDGKLHVHTATAGSVTANANADDLIIENSGFAGLSILTPNDQLASIVFGDTDDNDVAGINYDHGGNSMRFVVNGGEKVRVDAYGRTGIGTSSPGAELEIAGDYQPLIVNSTNSSGAKIILEDNGTTRGYLGATSTQPVTFYNSSATLIGCFDTNGTLLVGDTTTATGARLGVTGSDSAAGSLNYIMAIRNSDAYSTTPAGGILFQNKYTSGGAYADAGGIEVVKENATDGEYGFGLGLHTRANGSAITEKLHITGDGLVNIGGSAASYDTSPSQSGLSMYYETDSGLATIGTYSSGGATHLTFHTNTGGGANSEKVRVDSSGNVGIGTTSINQLLHLNSAAGAAINMTSGSGYLSQILLGTTAAPNHGRIQYNAGTGHMLWCTNDSSTAKMELDDAGALSITGALSKGSGSFKIDHPLPAKKDTHHLVHSFVEGPQADLIYRGRASLVDGEVSVNIDDAAGMTSGTFEVLCRDIQAFTSNETGWTAVRGSVAGATLTIEAQDADCTDTISWMVVGERKDQHMFDTGWTDDDGKVIVEPLKQADE